MHLVLRSSHAKGEWSFRKPQIRRKVEQILEKFSEKFGVQILVHANVGNHLHLQIKTPRRLAYIRFIRAVTSGIAMAVTGRNRWSGGSASGGHGASGARGAAIGFATNAKTKTEGAQADNTAKKFRFWDLRPFTRIVVGMKAIKRLVNYIFVNQLEGLGHDRSSARFWVSVGYTSSA